MYNHPTGLFSGNYISVLNGWCPLKFLHPLQPLNCISSWTLRAGRPQVGLCPIFLGSFCFTRLSIWPQDLRAQSTDCRETLLHDHYLDALYNASLKIRGPLLDNFGGQKHAKFGPILHNFRDRKYLRNRSTY